MNHHLNHYYTKSPRLKQSKQRQNICYMVPERGIPVAVRYLRVVKDREALIGTLIALKLSGLLTKICARLDWWLQLAAVLDNGHETSSLYHRSSLRSQQEWVINCGKTLALRLRTPAARLHLLTSGARFFIALRTCNFQNIAGMIYIGWCYRREISYERLLAVCTWWFHIPRTLQIRNTNNKINSMFQQIICKNPT